MATPTTRLEQFLKTAASQIGVREGRDKNGNWNNRVKYNDWYAEAIGDKGFLTSAWCAIFVSWCANATGVLKTVIPMHAWTPSGLNWFNKKGLVTRGKGARRGDIFYVYYPKQNRVAHVGIVERVEGNSIITIEGNTNTNGSSQGNGVYRLKRTITDRLYFCHPQWGSSAPTPPAPKPKPAQATVSVKAVRYSALSDPPKSGNPTSNGASVKPVEDALAKLKFLASKYADGHFGTTTVKAYAAFQRSLGYKGKDADGIPGRASLEALGSKTGLFRVVD